MTDARRPYFYGLDLVRFAAAAMVAVFHLGYRSWSAPHSTGGKILQSDVVSYPSLTAFAWFGWIGVEIFFVISGFVIVGSANNTSPISFLKGRVSRLYPAAWVCACISAAVLFAYSIYPAPELMHRLAGSLSLWVGGPWIDGVYWTLAVEIIFYALIFLVLLTGQFSRVRLIALGLTLWSAAYVLPRLLIDLGLVAAPGLNLWTPKSDLLLLRHGALFGAGIWIWVLARSRLSPAGWLALGFAVIVSCGEVLLRTIEIRGASAAAQAVAPVATLLVGIAIIIISSRFAARLNPASPRTQAFIRRLGLMTYPLYLLHEVSGPALIRLLTDLGLPSWPALFASFALVVAASWIVARFIEPPLKRAMLGVLGRGETALPRRPFPMGLLFRSGGDADPAPAVVPAPARAEALS
jgi:exopolysaccharide production protein ExoZ